VNLALGIIIAVVLIIIFIIVFVLRTVKEMDKYDYDDGDV